jgi:tetratricopeptide (TPR) repeat protein
LFRTPERGSRGEYTRTLELDPKHAKAHNNLALAQVELGELEEAAAHFQASLAIEPKAEIYSDVGFTLAQLGKSQDALANYQKALALDPTCASAHLNLAVAFVQAGNCFAEAESHYARRSRDGTAETHNGLGYTLAREGRPDEAIAAFRKAIEIDPHFTPAYNNLAEALAQQGKLEEAAETYRRSLAEKPSPAVSNALDSILKRLGKTDQASL